MKREDVWKSVTIKAAARYNGVEYDIVGYTYHHMTKLKEAIILKDKHANSVIVAPIEGVELIGRADVKL